MVSCVAKSCEGSGWSRRWLVHGDLLAERAQLNVGASLDLFGAEVAEGLRSGIDVRLVAVGDAIGGGEDLVGDGDGAPGSPTGLAGR